MASRSSSIRPLIRNIREFLQPSLHSGLLVENVERWIETFANILEKHRCVEGKTGGYSSIGGWRTNGHASRLRFNFHCSCIWSRWSPVFQRNIVTRGELRRAIARQKTILPSTDERRMCIRSVLDLVAVGKRRISNSTLTYAGIPEKYRFASNETRRAILLSTNEWQTQLYFTFRSTSIGQGRILHFYPNIPEPVGYLVAFH